MLSATILCLPEVTSTQDVARTLPLGSVVMADLQTRGRGRLDRHWEAPAGTALLASFVLPVRPLASLAAGVAAAQACGPSTGLKWPNDLVLDGRKLGGILIEGVDGRLVVGIGINLGWAPPGAAKLGEDRDRLLERLVSELDRWFGVTLDEVLEAWRKRSVTLGCQVRVELPGQVLEGLAEDVDGEGHLIVSGRKVAAGDVIHVRPLGGCAAS